MGQDHGRDYGLGVLIRWLELGSGRNLALVGVWAESFFRLWSWAESDPRMESPAIEIKYKVRLPWESGRSLSVIRVKSKVRFP